MPRSRTLPNLLVAGATAAGLAACGAAHGAPATATLAGASGAGALPVAHAAARATATGDWPGFGYDAARTDDDPSSTGITAHNTGRLTLRTVTLDGIADSSAIALNGVTVRGHRHDVAIVTTSYGNTIAVDAATGRRLWEYRAPGVNRSPGNPQVTTASPVADPGGHAVYVPAPSGVIVKLSLATGRPLWTRSVTDDPVHEKIASALNVDGANVVVVTGGYNGDIPPYDGHVATISRATGRIVHVWNSECSSRHRLIRAASCPGTDTRGDNAMWGRAGAVIEPGSGRILTATGNGPFNGHTNWGNSVLELTPNASALLHSWTPRNEAALSSGDVDVGSASPALLPSLHGRHLAVQGGKDGLLHVLDLSRLDGTTGGASPRLGGQLSQISTPGGDELLTAPAVTDDHGTDYLFAGTNSGTAGYRLSGTRLLRVWSDATPATSPVLAGGLLYAYDPEHGAIDIRLPLSGRLLRSVHVPAGHWNSPIVSDGRVILPTGNYHAAAGTSALEILHLPGH